MFAIPLHAQIADRITQSIDTTKIQLLAEHHPSWANPANAFNLVPANQTLEPLTLVLSRSPLQEQQLQQLLSEQQNPASPNYHHWLTPTGMGERFGLSQGDLDTLRGWLESQALQVSWVSPSRTFIGFTGTAENVGRAFHTTLAYYNVNGVRRMSVSTPPMIPQALAPVIKAVRGLYTLQEHPLHSAISMPHASPKVTFGGYHYLAPADFATIYNLPASLDGSGEAIGIVGRSRTDFADFTNFKNATNTSFANPTEIIPTAYGGVDPGKAASKPPSTDDQLEATIDVTRAASVAQGAKILLVVATQDSGGIGADAMYLVQKEPLPAHVMNVSFGECESEAGPSGVSYWDTLFKQAAGEGISVFVASGDAGASGCDNYFATPPADPAANSPNYICSSSYATCVGGTEFNDTANPSKYWSSSNGSSFSSALGYIPEGGWNEPFDGDDNTQAASSGGGVSSVIATPSWQTGKGVASARAGRYTPDMAFSASGHDGYFACFASGGNSCVADSQGNYSFEYFFGTSAAAPDMAGVTALLDQSQGSAVGNVAPVLYQMAASTPAVFHDVNVSTSGVSGCTAKTPSMCNNSIPGPTSLTGGQAGYLVSNGYDLVTGLGSIDVSAFISNFGGGTTSGLQFVPVTPCRVADTRNATGQFGGPELARGTTRDFDIPQSACHIPSSAAAYSLNVTVVPSGGLGYLSIWPSGQAKPVVSTLNSDGRVKANAAIVPAGSNGGVSVYVSDPSHVILDINGYFAPAGTASALAYYPLTPCRAVDTRSASGSLGGPSLQAGASRSFPLQTGSCNLPGNAKAYSLNVTAIPQGDLGYLSLYPTGQSKPTVSTLNASTGTVTANAALLPAGTNGAIEVYVSNASDVVLDVNGYFAPPADGGLSLYTVTPCRVLDTRNGSGAFTGKLEVEVASSACAPSSTAQAYVLNATVVPPSPLGYLTLWPHGENQPNVSTLNASDGAITSNMAIVPTNDGNVNAFASSPTQLILDLSAYFAP